MTPPTSSSPTCHWRGFDGKPVGSPVYAGEKVFEISGSSYGMTGTVEIVDISHPPTGRVLSLSLAIRSAGKGDAYAIVATGVDTKVKGALPWTANWEKTGTLSSDRWTVVHCRYVLPPHTNLLRLILHNPNRGAFFLATPHLTVGEAAPQDTAAVANAVRMGKSVEAERKRPSISPAQKLHDQLASESGPAIAYVTLRAPVKTRRAGETGVATFPVPSDGNGQVPLAFKIDTVPSGRLLGFKWRKREDGRNLVCEATARPGQKGVWVQYEAIVLVSKSRPERDDPRAWQGTSACVQSTDPRVRTVADKLARGAPTTEEYAHRAYTFARENGGTGAKWKALDACAALDSGGTCTNRANLAAALLRAHGIPARTVAHMPTWSSAPLYEHWLTEYWDRAQGWIALDPWLGRLHPDRRTRVVLSVASLSDENRAFELLHERFVMPGAPYQSVVELSKNLYVADLAVDDAINSGCQLCSLPLSTGTRFAALAQGGFPRRFADWSAGRQSYSTYRAILTAARAGDARRLSEALRR